MSEEEKIKNIEVETYASDMANVIGSNQDGVVKKVIEEQEKRDTEVQKISPERKRNTLLFTISAVLVVLAVVAIVLVFLFRKEILMVEVKPQYVPIIFTDQTEFQEISELKKEAIVRIVLDKINTIEIKTGGIEGIYFKENQKILGLRRFLELIEANLDQSKIDFVSDNFLIGIANKETKNLFFLIKMRSIVDIFDVMRTWENKMFFDLHQFFGVELNTDTKYLLEKSFEDGVVQNKNARILRDNNGTIIMMYVFAEEDSLIITNSEKTAEELILRLASGRVKK
jgi:hypothetical protein